MPMVRISGLLIYFAHVPKCAGTAVERYLKRRFGPLALSDPRHGLDGARWSGTSPQHIDAGALARLIPPGFCDGGFAVVRHPAERLRSLFRFQRDVEQAIAPDMTLATWLEALPDRQAADPFYLDNHPRLMCDLVPDDCTVFRLEDGLDAVVDWLDEVAGADDGPRVIAPANGYAGKLAEAGRDPGPDPAMTADVLERISEIYAADFARFGYAHTWPELSMEPWPWVGQRVTAAE